MKWPRCDGQNFMSHDILLPHRVECIEGKRIRGFTIKPYKCMECDFEFIPLGKDES